MPIERALIASLLKEIHLFRSLSEEDLHQVVDIVEEPVLLQEDETIYEQGGDGSYLFIVMDGKVNLTQRTTRGDHLLATMVRGDYFGQEALEAHPIRQTNATASTQVVLLRLDPKKLHPLAYAMPSLNAALGMARDSFRLFMRTRLNWRNPDEAVYYISRKAHIFLWLRLLPPLFFGFLLLALLLWLFIFLFPGSGLLTGLMVLTAVICLGWFIWNWADWANDYSIITNQRVISLEKVVLFYESRQETPLEAILSINQDSDQLGRWLDYGDVLVRSFTGTLPMRKQEHPKQVIELLEELWFRTKGSRQRAEKTTMRRIVRERLGLLQPQEPKIVQEEQMEGEEIRPGLLQRWLSNFFRLRYEENGVITYRTHWFILLQRIGLPTLVLIGLIVLLVLSIIGKLAPLPAGAAAVLILVLMLIAIGWWIYKYLDWRYDIYVITADQVLDIDKKPLGHENKRAAPIKNILSVNYERLGIIGLLLNYGTVTILVGDSKLTFDRVFNPSEVQRELFWRFGEVRDRERRAAIDADRQRVMDMLEAYDFVKNQQARSQEDTQKKPFSE